MALGERERDGLALRRRSSWKPVKKRLWEGETEGRSPKLRDGLREESAENAMADVDRCRRRPRSVADSPDRVLAAATRTNGAGLLLRLRPRCISGSGDGIALGFVGSSTDPMVASMLVAMALLV